MCLSVLVGARVLATSDDTVAVLAAGRDLVAGQRLEAGDLTEVRLRFTSDEDADRYLPAGEELPVDAVLLRAVAAGELVPRSTLSTDGEGLVEVPVPVDPGGVPASVRPGSLVDVWAGGGRGAANGGSRSGGRAERLLSGVPVLSISRAGGLGSSGLRQVVVGIPAGKDAELTELIGRLGGPLVIVRRPG